MGTFSIWHWIVVLLIVLVLFGGRGKVSALMGDFGKGLKSFKKGMKDDDDEKKDEAPKAIMSESAPTADPAPEKDSVSKN